MKALGFRSSRAPVLIAGAGVTVVITLAFLLLFWNRFVGLRSGDGNFSAGLMLLSGIVPYRDYYCATPPLFILRTAAVLAVFGKTMLAIRAFGVFERLLLAVILYNWLARFFKAGNAALATIITIIASSLDFSDPVSSYNHFTILMSVAAGYVSSYALDENRATRRLLPIGCLAGILSFGSIACKQSVGLAITVAIPVVAGACLLRRGGIRRSAAYVGAFVAGWLASLALLVLWFVRIGILQVFLRQIFVTGPAAKAGHPGDFLIRAIYVMGFMQWEAGLGFVGALLCCAAVYRASHRDLGTQPCGRVSWWTLGTVLLLGVASIALSFIVPRHLADDYFFAPRFGYSLDTYRVVRSLIYLVFFGTALTGFFYFLGLFRKDGLTRRESQFLLFLAVSFCVAFMLSLSYPAFEVMIVPGLGLFLAALLELSTRWRRWLLYTACLGLLVFEVQEKLDTPFEFALWAEPPVALAGSRSALPELKGLRLPASTVYFVDNTVRIIQQNSSPTDTIYVYPEFAVLYGLSHRMPATFSGSHNLDVAPDAFAREEAARLLKNPPAVLIFAPETDLFLIGQEMLWRNGLPSGQRSIIASINTLRKQYKLAARFNPDGTRDIYIYVRPASWPHPVYGKRF